MQDRNKHLHVQDWTRNHPHMVSGRKASGAIGGWSARACDNCVKNRARFYCAADDAFLCRPCDSSVHSANALARRHERVRLRVFTSSGEESRDPGTTWHRGFTRKARTPRKKKKKDGKFLNSVGYNNNQVHVVPEIGSDEARWPDESEDHLQLQLLYCVPMLDAELRMTNGVVDGAQEDVKTTLSGPDVGLEGIAADVNRLPGKRRRQEEDELIDIGEYELLECDEDRVKIEASDQNLDMSMEYSRNLNNRKPFLRLDYEGLLSEWDGKRSPWMGGERPSSVNSGVCWGDIWGTGGGSGREARVWRYREKRQRRLFSKRIRYEVRKRNAEKRPRVKGRFVKREENVQ